MLHRLGHCKADLELTCVTLTYHSRCPIYETSAQSMKSPGIRETISISILGAISYEVNHKFCYPYREIQWQYAGKVIVSFDFTTPIYFLSWFAYYHQSKSSVFLNKTFTFYRLAPISKPVNKRLVLLLFKKHIAKFRNKCRLY